MIVAPEESSSKQWTITRAGRRAIDSVQGTGNYAEVTILVRFCQVATRYGVPETEELSLAAMGLHNHNQIAKLSRRKS